MPIYEYECVECRGRIEELQKLADPPLSTCPACGGALRRLLSAPAVQFKGSGWYVTDYAGKGNAEKAAGAKEGAAGNGGGDGGGETKSSTATAAEAGGSKATGSAGSGAGDD